MDNIVLITGFMIHLKIKMRKKYDTVKCLKTDNVLHIIITKMSSLDKIIN